jgi:ATP-dependent DNA helicase RecQ
MGDGENKTFPFHLETISKKLKVKPLELYSAITFLEKMGILMLNEEGKKSSVVTMSMQSEELDHFYKTHPDWEEPIKLLLRSYGGIFTNYIKIYEEDLAKRSETDVTTIMTQLKELSAKGVLVYIPRTKTPQISFLVNRVEESYLYFSDVIYKTRKDVAKKRLDAVLRFVESTDQCRSQLLLAYFGEKKSTPCGTCDVCLKWHNEQLRKKEHEAIVEAIQKLKGSTNKAIIDEVSKHFPENKVIEVLREMIDLGF